MKLLTLLAAAVLTACAHQGDLRGPLTEEDIAKARMEAEAYCATRGKRTVVSEVRELSVVFDCVDK